MDLRRVAIELPIDGAVIRGCGTALSPDIDAPLFLTLARLVGT